MAGAFNSVGGVDDTSPAGQSPGSLNDDGFSGRPAKRGLRKSSSQKRTGGSDSAYGALENDLTNQQIGRYLIQRRLGSGGTAVVYQAYDQVSGHSVALKILADTADEKTLIRFRREAMTSGALQHPNIVRTLQVGVAPHGDVAYIAMKLVEGESLSALLDRCGYLDPDEAAALLTPIAAALAHAHDNEIVHRDVKPSNILLQPTGSDKESSVSIDVLDHPVVPMLSDFGIARSLDAPELTNQGRTVGTPAFMAPEQCAGQRDIDGRADVYSLGAVLYRCVVGRQPFLGSTPQILHAHVYEPLTIDDDILRRLPPLVVEILARSLAKRPEDRYATAGEMAMALSEAGGYTIDIAPTASLAAPTATITLDDLPSITTGTSTSASVLVPGLPKSADKQSSATLPQPEPRSEGHQRRAIQPRYVQDMPPRTPRKATGQSTRRWSSLALLFSGVLVGAITALYMAGSLERLTDLFSGDETPAALTATPSQAEDAVNPSVTEEPAVGGEATPTTIIDATTNPTSSAFNPTLTNTATVELTNVELSTTESASASPEAPVSTATTLATLAPFIAATKTPTDSPTLTPTTIPTTVPTVTETPTITPTPVVPPSPTWTPPTVATAATAAGTIPPAPTPEPLESTNTPTATLLPPTPTWTPQG